MLTPQEYSQREERVRGGGTDELRNEKYIFLGVYFVVTLVSSFMNSGPNSAFTQLGLDPATEMVSNVIGAFIGVGIVALALMLSEVWLKWTCAACSGCGFISAILGLFMLLGGVASEFAPGGITPNPVTGVLNLAMIGWLIFILWRDIKQQS
jgi:hypothetical protein